MLNVHHLVHQTTAEGPGVRCCIWLQGCSIHCKGCFAKEMWSFSERLLMNPNDIINQIYSTEEGITICGGEPLEQKEELAELMCLAWKKGLSTVLYSGHTYESLLEMHDDYVTTILSHTDVLIDGPFVLSLLSTENPLVGSNNQQLRFLTKRYSPNDIKRNRLEIRVMKNGTLSINGMADYGTIRKIAI